ncbi:Queuosine Biosynthesis QueE Radical SAM [Mucinivorans hirudinis]|uniref:7-carboxy-7-deazaguanine synthase n=1 Tax=Mucinivorans hirudinis TaxID=1433126 RepID=A0A060RD84_9BACT|nr:Queuosine Biosynthesis QueE Radical SAM [Mucinivorans hirudinis]
MSKDILRQGALLPLVEDFYTIQGEGFHTGKPAYFIRLGGCDVGCGWCDAKFTWNPRKFPPVAVEEIVRRAVACQAKAIVITGGEPTLYPLGKLTEELKKEDFEIFIETSGTNPLTGTIDWVCLSPKPQQPPLQEVLLRADELKIIVESQSDLEWAEENSKKVSDRCLLFLQPEWSVFREITPAIVEYAKQNPRWNVSVQTHKFMKIP